MHEFLTYLKTYREGASQSDLEEAADTELVKQMMLQKLSKNDIIMRHQRQLGEYDSEILVNGKIFPGHMYTFIYDATQPTTYKFADGNVVEFFDKLPVILCVKQTQSYINGINMNLCTPDIRAYIIDAIWSQDPTFFSSSAELLARQGKIPLSEKIMSLMQKDLYSLINKSLGINVSQYIFRTYTASMIKQLRYIEPWQWKHIPFLTYKQTVKSELLNSLYKQAGMDKIKIL